MKHIKWFAPLVLFCILCLVGSSVYSARTQEWLAEAALTLEDCIRFAIENSYEVKLARLDFLIAQTDQGVQEAIYDTVLSADISYTKDKLEQLSVLSGSQTKTTLLSLEATKKLPSSAELTLSFSDTKKWSDSQYISRNPAYTAEAAIEVRQPLGKNIFGYIDKRNISITSLAIENADLDTKERIESLFAEIEKAYWEWAFAKKNLKVYRQILHKAQELHQTNIRNYDTGNIERADLLATQANVLIREKDVLIAENRYKSSEEKIKLLLNVDTAQGLYPLQPLQYHKQEIELGGCLSEAFDNRRDYEQAKRQLEIEGITLETKANARWPEIDLVASMTANGIDSEFFKATNDITTDNNPKYYAAVEISLPIENNLAQSEFKKARHNKEKALLTLKSLERSIVTEVSDAFRDYITYQAKLSKVEEAAQLQQEKLNEEEKAFRHGRSNTKRLIDYQQDYLNAELEVAKGLVELELAEVNLSKALNIILKRYKRLL